MDYAQMLAQYRAQRSPPAAAMGGTVDYAQLLAERRAQRQAQAVNEYNPAAGMSVIEKGLVGLGRGFTDAIEGAKQAGLAVGEKLGLAREGAAQGYAEAVRPERELFERGLGNDTAASIGRVVGETAPLLAVPVGGAATAGGRVGLAAATGAVTGALQLVDEEKGDSRLQNAALGALGGAAVGTALEGAGKVINAVRPKGTTTAYADPNAREVADLARQHNVPLSGADVTRSAILQRADTLAENVPIVGTFGFRLKQQDAAKAAAKNFVDQFDTGADVATTLRAGLQERGKRVTANANKLYQKVAEVAEPLGVVATDRMNITAKRFLDEASVLPEVAQNAGVKQILEQLSQPGGNTFGQLAKVRATLNSRIDDLISGGDFSSARPLKAIRNALDEDLTDFAHNAGDPQIKKAYDKANKYFRERVAPTRKADILRSARTDNPDEIYRKFIKYDAGTSMKSGRGQAERLYKALPEKGKAAVRYGIVKEAWEKSLSEAAGGEIFSPAKFANTLEKLQGASGVFFPKQDKAQIDGLIKLMHHIKRAGQIAENPPTGNRVAVGLTSGMIGAFAPGAVASQAASVAALKALLTTNAGKRLLFAASKRDVGSKPLQAILDRTERVLAATPISGVDNP